MKILHTLELERLVRAYPLATLIASTPEGLEANLLPLEWSDDDGERIRLRGHVARAHSLPQGCADGCRVLAVFQSPNAYISPRWYATRRLDTAAIFRRASTTSTFSP